MLPSPRNPRIKSGEGEESRTALQSQQMSFSPGCASKPRAAADRGHEKTPARFPALQVGFTRLAHAKNDLGQARDRGMKKPISGRREIGAHFVSFNFTNNVIWG
jgi:hypothetical protein